MNSQQLTLLQMLRERIEKADISIGIKLELYIILKMILEADNK